MIKIKPILTQLFTLLPYLLLTRRQMTANFKQKFKYFLTTY